MTSSTSAARTAFAVISPEPMTPRVGQVAYLAGATLAELLTAAVRDGALDPRDLGRTEIWIDGERIVDREAGLDIVPQPGQVVNIAVMAHGGGRGGNKALQAVLQIAIMAAAFYIGGPAAAGATGAKAVAFKVAAAAVAVGGQMAVAAAFAPHVDKLDDRAAYSLTSQSNSPRPYQQFPLAFGEGRVVFDLASSAFTSTIGDDVYITAIYGLHYGPCQLADQKLGGTLFSALSAGDVTFETFLTPGPRNSTLYPMRTVQDGYTDELEMGGDWVVHTSAEDAETIELDITFPAGLLFNKDNGKILPQEVQGRVEYSPAGANAWVAAPIGPYFTRTGAAVPAGEWYVQDRSKRTVRRTLTFKPAEKGQYDVRIKAWDPDSDDVDATTNTTSWTAMRSIENKAPVIDQNLSILVARFKATNSVNGSLPALSGVVTPICPVLEDDSWTGDAAVYSDAWKPTNNAAAHARYMVTGYPAARPLSALQIDDSFADAYAMIEARDWRGQVLVQENASQQDVLIKLGFMGRFSTYWNGRKLCAVTDWEKPAPRQLFAGLNAQGYTYTRAFPEEIHGVTVRFGNLDQDGLADELTVYADGYDKTNASLLDSYDLPFKTTAERAYREGRVWLAKRLYQSESHQWAAGFDGLVSTYGDRVLVRHTSTLFGQAESRVQNRRWSGALVSGIRLDGPVEMTAGKTYALDVRRPDGDALRNLLVVNSPGRGRDLIFATPLAEIEAPGRGDLVVFGEVDIITEDVEIIDVAPSSSRSVALRAQPYRFEDILAAETGPIPPLQTRLTARAAAPQPRVLSASGSPDGAVVAFDVETSRVSPIASFAARWRATPSELDPSPAWQALDQIGPDKREVSTPPFPESMFDVEDADRVQAEVRVDVEIRSVLANGDVSRAGRASGILIQRGVPEPQHFTAVGVKRTAGDGTSYPALAVAADAITAGTVQELIVETRPVGGSEASWTSAGHSLPAANPVGDYTGVKGGSAVDVRARWRSSDNWVSSWVVKPAVDIPAGALTSSNTLAIGELLASQIKAYTELTDKAVADAIDLRLRIYDAIVDAGGRVLDLKAELTPLSGRPVGATLDDQVRQVETAKETIIEHYTEMTVGFGNAAAALATEAIVRATQDEALSAYQVALAAVVNSNYSTLNFTIAALTTQQSTTAMALTTLTSSFNGNVSSVSGQLSTLSEAQSAQALSIFSLSSTVGGHTSSIFSISTALASINGQLGAAWGVDVTVDGRTIGIKGLNTGFTGGWVFDGDYFFFRTPGGNKPLVSITGGLIYLATDVRIGGNLVLDGSLTFGKVGPGELTESTKFADGSTVFLTTSDQSCGSVYVYCAGGDIDIFSYLAASNAGSSDAGVIVSLYVDGSLNDAWPLAFRANFTERPLQMTIVEGAGVGWHLIELRARAIESGSSVSKIGAIFNITNRRR